jgi:hypothetical protein
MDGRGWIDDDEVSRHPAKPLNVEGPSVHSIDSAVGLPGLSALHELDSVLDNSQVLILKAAYPVHSCRFL